MKNILLKISYDGTDFCGWQRQDKSNQGSAVRTVQGELEGALEKMFKQKINIYGSGRTDSGVHARAQAANFFSPVDSIPEENYVRALNSFLPKDVRVHSAKIVDENFNSRFSATSRSYRYFIQTQENPFARDSRYVWFIPYRPEIALLNQMASFLRGEIDCATFAAAGDKSLSTFRFIDKAHFFWSEQDKNLLVFEIEANAFLWKMVRSLTGTMIEFEHKKKSPEDFKKALLSANRCNAGVTAPPTGLFLWEVKFDGIRRHI